jgi:two-component system response regulator MprA
MAGEQILVVDDDPDILTSLRRALSYEGYTVRTASNGKEALDIAYKTSPDLVVLDIMMPELDGLEVCRRLRAGGDISILMLTAKDTTQDTVRGLDAGADDYLVKPFELEELLARIRSLLRRRNQENPEVLRFLDVEVNLSTREAFRAGKRLDLTAKEFDLLAFFLRHPRQVLPQDRILQAVWGHTFPAGTNTLHVYIGYLRKKLEEGGGSRIIHTVRSVGFTLRE